MRTVRTIGALAALVPGLALAEDLTLPTRCEGQIKAYNADGSYEVHNLVAEFTADTYLIRTINFRALASFDDSGTCAIAFGTLCRHEMPEDPSVFFTFTLEPDGEGRVIYTETWDDGGRSIGALTCTP